MAAAIKLTLCNHEFTIYTFDPGAMRTELMRTLTSDQIKDVEIVSLPNNILMNELVGADYGFLLRDKSIINEVSCPTKLVEYLSCGVVPILDSAAIGDFLEMGMNYVRLSDFRKGLMPTEAERACLAGVNYYVLKRYRSTCEEGMRDLMKLLFGPRKVPAYFIDDTQGISFNV